MSYVPKKTDFCYILPLSLMQKWFTEVCQKYNTWKIRWQQKLKHILLRRTSVTMGANTSSTLFVFVSFISLNKLERTLQQQVKECIFFVLSSLLLFHHSYFLFRKFSIGLYNFPGLCTSKMLLLQNYAAGVISNLLKNSKKGSRM